MALLRDALGKLRAVEADQCSGETATRRVYLYRGMKRRAAGHGLTAVVVAGRGGALNSLGRAGEVATRTFCFLWKGTPNFLFSF